MAAIALVTADRVRIVESIIQLTLPAAEAITAGQIVRIDTTTGRFTLANGTTAAEARVYGVAVRSVPAGMAVTAMRKGVLDGWNITGAYDDPVYAGNADGTLDTAAGTVSTVVGRVIPATSNTTGTALDKLIFVDL
jgi:hypothetical protein